MDPKPGWKSTEFWFSAIVAIWGMVVASGAVGEDDAWVKIVGAIVAGLASAGYSVARGTVKKMG